MEESIAHRHPRDPSVPHFPNGLRQCPVRCAVHHLRPVQASQGADRPRRCQDPLPGAGG